MIVELIDDFFDDSAASDMACNCITIQNKTLSALSPDDFREAFCLTLRLDRQSASVYAANRAGVAWDFTDSPSSQNAVGLLQSTGARPHRPSSDGSK
jgi:hypothetical protein